MTATAPPRQVVAASPQRVRPWWLVVVATYVLSRLLVAATALLLAVTRRDVGSRQAVWPWDGPYYVHIAAFGYPHTLPPASASTADVSYDGAFFPGYAYAIRALHAVALSRPIDGLVLSLTAGLVGLLLTRLLLARVLDPLTATRTAQLLAIAPGSVVLSLVYSEGLLLALSSACLLALHRRRWLIAGVLGLLACLSRPSALALEPVAAYLAWRAVRDQRDWGALVAPALVPLGFLGYVGWLGYVTGHTAAWLTLEKQGWNQHLNFGLGFGRPLLHPSLLWSGLWILFYLGFLTLAAAAWAAWRRGAGLPVWLWVYGVALVAQVLLDSSVGPRPRFLLIAFPVYALLAQGYRSPRAWRLLAAANAVALLVTTYLAVVPGNAAP